MAGNTYYFGPDEDALLGGIPKYFYAMRRTEEGDLFLYRFNQLSTNDAITINQPGPPGEDWTEFEYGVDFLDNVDEEHNIQYENLYYSQYRWDNRSMYYYIDANGSLIVRIGQKYVYPVGV